MEKEELYLKLIDAEDEYRTKFLGEENIIENDEYINNEKVFPPYWYSDFDEKTRLLLVTLALQENKLIVDLDEYAILRNMKNNEIFMKNIEESIKKKKGVN